MFWPGQGGRGDPPHPAGGACRVRLRMKSAKYGLNPALLPPGLLQKLSFVRPGLNDPTFFFFFFFCDTKFRHYFCMPSFIVFHNLGTVWGSILEPFSITWHLFFARLNPASIFHRFWDRLRHPFWCIFDTFYSSRTQLVKPSETFVFTMNSNDFSIEKNMIFMFFLIFFATCVYIGFVWALASI